MMMAGVWVQVLGCGLWGLRAEKGLGYVAMKDTAFCHEFRDLGAGVRPSAKSFIPMGPIT